MIKTTLTALVLGATALTSTAALAQDWRADLPVFRVGLLGGENEADRLRNNECFRVALEEALGVEVQLFPAADYAGVMQGLLAEQLDFATLGASGYAGIYMQDAEAVEPIFVGSEADASTGYVAMMYVRADSDIQTLDDMEGRSLAYADPNSTSGYLVPQFELGRMGITDDYFSQTGFGGGHEQAVIAVLNGQYDAGVTWTSGQGEHAEGYTRGNFRTMVNNGLVDMNDLRVIWTSGIIPNGPAVIRTGVPDEARQIVYDYLLTQHETDPACYTAFSMGEGQGWVPVDHEFYEGVIAMREATTQSR
ncbi:phosphonate ABC transporter substrate-binding protein [Roseicyclus mahoneyensis]|uniref:Phosphonate transport system substrate-binding protein n=1 Tax=Roseicyclus mahoneyensis TaxID=164332 RepID=A0A316GB37_9RHOB|nr:phosphonate ABC transporter substrate-binding protein [Roseicyclus mahoneyensis]PWK58098.1 phosphonate transport system substrate-binding protein [Roseicyclus mahoneyensis]